MVKAFTKVLADVPAYGEGLDQGVGRRASTLVKGLTKVLADVPAYGEGIDQGAGRRASLW